MDSHLQATCDEEEGQMSTFSTKTTAQPVTNSDHVSSQSPDANDENRGEKVSMTSMVPTKSSMNNINPQSEVRQDFQNSGSTSRNNSNHDNELAQLDNDRFLKLNRTRTESSEYITIDIANHNHNLLKLESKSQDSQKQLTGDVDIIGILNASNSSDISMASMTPSEIFERPPVYNTISNYISNSRPPHPPSPHMNPSSTRPKSSSTRGKKPSKTGITYHANDHDDASTDFPTIEVNILSHGSSYSQTDSATSPNSIDNKAGSVIGGQSFNSTPLSPLTPKGEENPTRLHRRMSSSDRLLKMLEDMNKKKPFDVDDYRDEDDDDDEIIRNHDDDDDEFGSTGMRMTGTLSQLSCDTTPTANLHYTNGINTRSGRLSVDANSSSRSSTLSSSFKTKTYDYATLPQLPSNHMRKRSTSNGSKNSGDATLYAQSFILAIAFFAVWSQQNLMAPNLTQMAEYFNFSPEQRDLYLGANIALATGVLSLPVSGALGFLADVVSSRIKLFAGTVCVGGIAAICTGMSDTYAHIYFSRFLSGGCMAGSVVIAFSILGDLFDAKDRNVASSGLTAMMGAGILMGQVFAGTVGDIYTWKIPFYVSGIFSIITSMMVLRFVNEPVRGGKEKVLQEMLASGTKYDRKLTLNGFIHAMTKNKTNIILMLQGFFTNVPWGIIFTFLNDYLSQEQGLSVPTSTFLVFCFGIGSAVGGVYGGIAGGACLKINRALLPLFMAGSTLLGIGPFLGLLDWNLKVIPIYGIILGFSGGMIANLTSVNVRPCILNVNPPETRGAAMTANNLMVNVARGAGPSLITLSQSLFGVSRQFSFNVTVSRQTPFSCNPLVKV